VAAVVLIVLPTIVATPGLWLDWIDHLLLRGTEPNQWGAEIGIPLTIRMAASIALMTWGAATGRPWLTAPAVVLAMPILWFHSLALLAALPRLLQMRDVAPIRWRG
jgi:hypothetical protein